MDRYTVRGRQTSPGPKKNGRPEVRDGRSERRICGGESGGGGRLAGDSARSADAETDGATQGLHLIGALPREVTVGRRAAEVTVGGGLAIDGPLEVEHLDDPGRL